MSDSRRITGAAGGALGMGAFAALFGTCCVAPWTIGLVGVTGAVTLARLSFLQPYFLVATAGLLAAAFWWAYRKPVADADGSCEITARRTAQSRLRWLVWLAAALVCCLALASMAPFALATLIR